MNKLRKNTLLAFVVMTLSGVVHAEIHGMTAPLSQGVVGAIDDGVKDDVNSPANFLESYKRLLLKSMSAHKDLFLGIFRENPNGAPAVPLPDAVIEVGATSEAVRMMKEFAPPPATGPEVGTIPYFDGQLRANQTLPRKDLARIAGQMVRAELGNLVQKYAQSWDQHHRAMIEGRAAKKLSKKQLDSINAAATEDTLKLYTSEKKQGLFGLKPYVRKLISDRRIAGMNAREKHEHLEDQLMLDQFDSVFGVDNEKDSLMGRREVDSWPFGAMEQAKAVNSGKTILKFITSQIADQNFVFREAIEKTLQKGSDLDKLFGSYDQAKQDFFNGH